MFAFVLAGCLFAAGLAIALSLLLGDVLIHARADDDARSRRRARVFRTPALVVSRPVFDRRRMPARNVAVDRRRAA